MFQGPRRIARYDAEGAELLVPTAGSLTPCSPPSRRGLVTGERGDRVATASHDGGYARRPGARAYHAPLWRGRCPRTSAVGPGSAGPVATDPVGSGSGDVGSDPSGVGVGLMRCR